MNANWKSNWNWTLKKMLFVIRRILFRETKIRMKNMLKKFFLNFFFLDSPKTLCEIVFDLESESKLD